MKISIKPSQLPRIVTIAGISLLTLWATTDQHAYANPSGHKPSHNSSGSDPKHQPAQSGSGQRPGGPSSKPPSGSGAAAPIKSITKALQDAELVITDICFEFDEHPDRKKDPEGAWQTVIGASPIPAKFQPLLTYGPNDTMPDMETKLESLVRIIYADQYIRELKKYLEDNKHFITGEFTTSQGSTYYIIRTSEGTRIIRLKYDGSTASMSSSFVFLSQEQYEAYKAAYLAWQNQGMKKDFVFTGAYPSLGPVPGGRLIEWSNKYDPNAPTPVQLKPNANGSINIIIPRIKGLEQHFSHEINEVKE